MNDLLLTLFYTAGTLWLVAFAGAVIGAMADRMSPNCKEENENGH